MGRDAAEGVRQNKSSHKGEDNRKGNQPNKVRDIEKVGSSGAHGVRFGMPTDNEVSDHSVVRKLGA